MATRINEVEKVIDVFEQHTSLMDFLSRALEALVHDMCNSCAPEMYQ